MSSLVVTDLQDGVLFVRLNRPRAGNALGIDMLSDLERHLSKAREDSRVVVAVLCANGVDFCRGLDLAEAFGMSSQTAQKIGFAPDVPAWRRFPRPTICAVEGAVRGLGLSLVEASDICIAGDTATFQHDELSLGLLPAGGSFRNLPRLVGMRKATDMLLSGLALTAQEALRVGLVSRLVPQGGALEAARVEAASLRRLSRPLVAQVKQMLAGSRDQADSPDIAEELQAFARMFALGDRLEGTGAALQGRQPRFRHR